MPHRHTLLGMVLAILLTAAAGAGDWPRVEVDRPMSLTVRTNDGRSLGGKLAAYDGAGFDLVGEGGVVERVAWRDLPASRTYQVLERLLDPKDAEAWLRLGELLMSFGDEGKAHAEPALKRAAAVDASLSSRIEAVRRGEPDPGTPAPVEPAEAAPTADAGAGNPEIQGAVEERFWGDLSETDQKESVEELNAFAKESLTFLRSPAKLYETDYFLFYSDLPAGEAREWSALLDKMYARLADLFAVPEGKNLWRGKALVLVFAEELMYQRFETQVLRVPPGLGAAGRCWQYGDGRVVIAFYRQPNKWVFAHVLVHETVHGFLHRYRSPERIPSGWNEGLAEVIASELVPQSPVRESRLRETGEVLRATRSTGGFFQAEQIEPWHYGVGMSLTEYMIGQNRKGYVAFINGIKDGQAWRESLEKNYGVELNRLVQFYGESMRVRDLRP